MINSTVKDPLASMGLKKSLLNEAFTHGSLDEDISFERLEFLGDSIIEACVSTLLYESFPETNEGPLSRWRSALVSQQTLSEISCSLGLKNHLRAHPDQLEDLKENTRIQASLFESLCAAVFLDKGYDETFKFIEKNIMPYFDRVEDLFKESDPKTNLQELAQKHLKVTPSYKKEESTGPSHAPSYLVSVWFADKKVAVSQGHSIKEAEQKAAKEALKNLKKDLKVKL